MNIKKAESNVSKTQKVAANNEEAGNSMFIKLSMSGLASVTVP